MKECRINCVNELPATYMLSTPGVDDININRGIRHESRLIDPIHQTQQTNRTKVGSSSSRLDREQTMRFVLWATIFGISQTAEIHRYFVQFLTQVLMFLTTRSRPLRPQGELLHCCSDE